jgi:hypothetical protein
MSSKPFEFEARFLEERIRFSDDAAVGTAMPVNGSVKLALDAGVADMTISIKGDWESHELQRGHTYRFYGRFSEYTNKATGKRVKQFQFSSFDPVVAHDEEGIVSYLESIGRGFGMGIGTAKKCWAKWGGDAVRVIRENPCELLHVNPRITEQELSAIGQKLVDQKATEDCMIQLTNLLRGRGFPKKLPRALIKKYGNAAGRKIRKDWALLGFMSGCGFARCDQFYKELGYRPERLKRQAICAAHFIATEANGDVWLLRERVEGGIRAAIGPMANPVKAIEFCLRLAKISPRHFGALAETRSSGLKGPLSEFGDRCWLAEASKAEQERELAERIVLAMSEDKPRQILEFETAERTEVSFVDHVRCNRCSRQLTAPEVHIWNNRPFGPTCIQSISDGEGVTVVSLQEWMESHPVVKQIMYERPAKLVDLPAYSLWPEVSELELSAHQKAELSQLLVGRVSILGGSPGTGKTYSVAQLVKLLLASGRVGLQDIAVGAPTGKAAVRVTENLNANRIPIRARTCHSLLGAGVDKETGQFGFAYNENNQWDYKVVIFDEESMKDMALMLAVFRARPHGCHFLLVGDTNQLPPVGPGAPLRDMIAAGVPSGRLTEIQRNSGGIVEACRDIRDGKPWAVGDNLHLHDCKSPEEQLQTIEELLDRCMLAGLDPVWDVQVACAVNLKSPLSRWVLNRHLQPILNQNQPVPGCPFRLGDKIICTDNGYYPLTNPDFAGGLDPSLIDDDGKVYVANGEMAKVLEIEPKRLVAELYNPTREIIIPRGKSDDDSEDGEASSGCKFDLAYAITAHRSQGSEWPAYIVVLDEYSGARQVCDKAWLYTEISRAKDVCHLVGRKHVADSMCKRDNLSKRKTFLRERILQLQSQQLLEGV